MRSLDTDFVIKLVKKGEFERGVIELIKKTEGMSGKNSPS